ncbi:MAG: peptidoglycan-binding protein [Methyloceanibacter sp.]|uniref:peptidoglycan-binding protein n=1 Tax=Methyloceanibacter sp. TaxID=1965321 RepID=UPI003D6CB4E0
MASEASWQTSGRGSDAFTTEQPMDQRTVEVLLRRLVERVEESERRYGEALDELHARLDQLSQTAEAARDAGTPEDADTFDRLHSQVSNLARRLEQDTAPLDDFERLGKALTDSLNHGATGEEAYAAERVHDTAEPSPFAQAAMAAKRQTGSEPGPTAAYPDFGYAPAPAYGLPPLESETFGEAAVLDKRLMEIAQRLEESIGTAMPTVAIEALNRKLDDIGSQLSQALGKAPAAEALAYVERQISDMGQQLAKAEEQLGKIGGIEGHLLKLIERLDEKPASPAQAGTTPAQLQEIAGKAAAEAARLVAGEAKQSGERLDAMHRDITAMSGKSRESGDRLVKTLEAVHESLKQLVQQVERGAPALQPKPRASLAEKTRQAEAKPATPLAQAGAAAGLAPAAEKQIAAKTGAGGEAAAKKETLRDRLGAAIPDFAETEVPPPFGRAKRASPDDEAVDLDATQPRKARMRAETKPAAADASFGDDLDAPDDLVAAARRAAQAAALRAEERSGRRGSGYLAGSSPGAEQTGRRKRSLLMIAAAVLLALSAALLYGRLASKPDEEVTVPATEESAPAPAAEGTTEGDGAAPAGEPDKSGAWEVLPIDPADNATRQGATTGFTEVAKSKVPPMPASELLPEPQLASLKPDGQAALPPGVIFSIEDPLAGTEPNTPPQGVAVTTPLADLPLPPDALGTKALREAAKAGDAKAQYAVATRYAEGKNAVRDLKTAAQWFEQAAASGLAPAQYRLAAMYERGLGVDKDPGKARSWYAAAAENGNVKAMHNLAVSVSGREGGESDYALAAKWYGEAAAYGLADSQFNLGILAEHGLGTAKSLEEAYKWFALAAANGDAEAAKRREVIKVQLAPSTFAGAEAAVKAWKPKEASPDANEVAEEPIWVATAPKAENAALVTRAQMLLNQLGYDVGPPDGVAGERTRTAIKLFERRNGLEETGSVTIPLVTQLERLTS